MAYVGAGILTADEVRERMGLATLKKAVAHRPVPLTEGEGIGKSTPHHVPAGSPDGGQFTTAERAGGGNPNMPQSADNPAGFVDNDSITSDPIGGIMIPAALAAGGIEAGIASVRTLLGEAAEATGAEDAAVAEGAIRDTEWKLGEYKSPQRWQNQMRERGWTEEEITDTIKNGEQHSAPNYVHKGNS